MVLAAAVLAAACEQSPPGGESGDPGRGTGGSGPGNEGGGPGVVRRGVLPVRDGDVVFDVYSFVCGETLGTMERTLEPEGYFCDVGISAFNRGTSPVRLDPFQQLLVADGQPREPWEEAMRAIVLNEPDNLFVQEIPTGGGGTVSLIFELPDGAVPERLELHGGEGSPGAVVRVSGCGLWKVEAPGPCALDERGNVRGTAFPAQPAVGISYPVSFHAHEAVGLCFAGRDWRLRPSDADLSRLDGHGVLTLRSPDLAEYRDNSGVVLRLAPTAPNDRDAAVCG